jgi:acetylornithine deacetylase/succinyl-diaminopimelate desuccinylase-like protein
MLQWHQQNPDPAFELVFLATMGEETGTFGAHHFAKQNKNIDLMIVGEPTQLQPVIGHKGVWRFYLEAFGKASHSSMPQQGENANELMIDALAFLKEKIKPEFESIQGSSLSITMIHGGSTINIIPDYCRVDIDTRFLDGSKIDECKSLIKKSLTQVRFSELQNYPAYVPRDNSTTKELLFSALQKNNIIIEPKIEPWYSDAGPLSNAGIDTLVWGPGDIRDAHTVDEKIAIDELHSAVNILEDFLGACEDYYGSN